MKITIQVDLDDLGIVRIGEDEYGLSPETIDQMVEEIKRQAFGGRDVIRKVQEEIESIVKDRVRQEVSDILTGEIQVYDKWDGTRKGEPTTVREMVMNRVNKFITAPPADRRAYGAKSGNLGEFLDDAVKEALSKEFKPTIDEARKAIKGEIIKRATEGAAKALAEGVR